MKHQITEARLTMNDNDWRAEDDMRTLMEADKIKKDAKRLKAAKAMARKKLESMKCVAEMGAARKK